jgi:hypothetical protein
MKSKEGGSGYTMLCRFILARRLIWLFSVTISAPKVMPILMDIATQMQNVLETWISSELEFLLLWI